MISFVQTIKDQDLKDMPIVMINMVLNETFKINKCDDCSECPLKHTNV